MRIDIFSDTVCPWCYLGKRRLELAVATRPQYEVQLTWRPFELNPEIPFYGIERRAYMAARAAESKSLEESEAELSRIGIACGIQFRFDLIERMPNTRMSHLLIAHASRFARQGAVKERVMRAYLEEGCDIGDVEELVRLGAEVGLPEAATRRTLVTRSGQDGVVAAERHAHVLGISGVPTFIFDGQYTLSGAQEVGTFAQVLDQVAEFEASKGNTA